MKTKEVTIIIDFKIYLYLFEPIIRYLLKKDITVYIASSTELLPEIKVVLQDPKVIYFDYNQIKSKNRIRYGIHRAFSILFTREDFSFQFKKKRQQSTKKFTGLQGKLLKIAKFTPKVPNSKINSFLQWVASIGLKNQFPTKTILVGSLNASAELLCAKDMKVVTIMESWDHAVKEPNGYKSDLFLGWNQSMCDDWKRVQGDRNCEVFHPLKLRYGHEKFNWVSPNNSKKRILYPVASTAKFSIKILVDIERKIIQELVDVTKNFGWELYIKPRPNGMDGEFDKFKAYEHVIVGEVSHSDIKNPANYYYSDEVNAERFKMLEQVDLVVNAFTTYGLDAAAAGLPVLQLDLRKTLGFEESDMVYNNYHIKNYLINTSSLISPQRETLQQHLLKHECSLIDIATEYTAEINQWLYHYSDSDSAIESCIGKILN